MRARSTTATSNSAATGVPLNGATVYITLLAEINEPMVFRPSTPMLDMTQMLQLRFRGPSFQGLRQHSNGPPVSVCNTCSGIQGSGRLISFIGAYILYRGITYAVVLPAITADDAHRRVTLQSQINGVWYCRYTSAVSFYKLLWSLTTPAPGRAWLSSVWPRPMVAGGGPAAYLLNVGTKWPGSDDIYGSGVTTATSATVSGLPTDGVTVYVLLRSEINGVWYDTNYTYTAAGQTAPPVLTSPSPGSHLSSSTVMTFQWSPGSGVTGYTLAVGDQNGQAPSICAWLAHPHHYFRPRCLELLPTDGVTVLPVTLRYQIEGVWSALFYTYTAEGSTAPPVMMSPSPGSHLSSSTVNFQWSPGSGVTGYTLTVGTKYPGSIDVGGTPTITSTSATMSGLPTDGVTVYVMLRYRIEGVWSALFYTYTAAGSTAPPVLTSPSPGSHLSSSTVNFQWSPGSGVTGYTLAVGTKWPGSIDIYGSPTLTTTSATVSGLPTDGVTVYVTLRYQIEGVWSALFYTYTAEGSTAPPVMTTPAPGSVLSGSSVTFQWTPGTGVTAYSLFAGTYGPGYFNIGGSPTLTTTSFTVPNIPTDSKPVYVTLRYQIDGVWQTTNYTYTAAPSPDPAIISPTPGSRLPGSTVNFFWSNGVDPIDNLQAVFFM